MHNNQDQMRLFTSYERYVTCVAVYSILIGFAVLIGYAYNITLLKSVTPFWLPMRSTAAVSFVLTGFALWNIRKASEVRMKHYAAGKIIALIILLISIFNFYEYISGFSLGIDRAIFYEHMRIDEIIFPGRTTVATTFSLFFLSLALLLVDTRLSALWFQVCACIVLTISFMGLLSYFYNVNSVHPFTYFTKMPIHTSITLILLSIAIILMRPNSGMIEELLADTCGGKSLRTLLPLIFVIPTFIGFLENVGEWLELFDPAFGDNIQLTFTIALLGAAVIINAKQIDKDEIKRKEMQNIRDARK